MEWNKVPRKYGRKRVQLKHSNLTEAERKRIKCLVAHVLLLSKGKPLRSTVAKRIKNLPINTPLNRVKKTVTRKYDETPENMREREINRKQRKLDNLRAALSNQTPRSAESSASKRQVETRPEISTMAKSEITILARPYKKLKTKHEKPNWTVCDRQVRAKPERQVSLMDFENIPSSSCAPTQDRISFMSVDSYSDVDQTPQEDIAMPSTSRGHATNFGSSYREGNSLDKTLSLSDTYSSSDDTSNFDDDDDEYYDIDDDDALSSFSYDSEMSSDEDSDDGDNIDRPSSDNTTESHSGDSERNRGLKRTVSMMSVEYSKPCNYDSKTQYFDEKDSSLTSDKFKSFENVHRDRTISFMSVEYSSPSKEDAALNDYQINGNYKKRRRTSTTADRSGKLMNDDEEGLTGVISFECMPSGSNGNPKVLVESVLDYQKRWYGQMMNVELWE